METTCTIGFGRRGGRRLGAGWAGVGTGWGWIGALGLVGGMGAGCGTAGWGWARQHGAMKAACQSLGLMPAQFAWTQHPHFAQGTQPLPLFVLSKRSLWQTAQIQTFLGPGLGSIPARISRIWSSPAGRRCSIPKNTGFGREKVRRVFLCRVGVVLPLG